MGERGGDGQPVPGKQGGRSGEGRRFPRRTGQPEGRGATPLPYDLAIQGRGTPARLPARFPLQPKCTSHLGFGLGVSEYWRFDENPTRSNLGLAGDRLVDGEYQPIVIEVLPDRRLRGSSTVLDLILEWHDGQLNLIDPQTEAPIASIEDEREARLAEREGRLAEQERRLLAEARVRELEEELARRDTGP